MLERALADFRRSPELAAAIVHWRTFPAREARTRPLPEGLDPRLVAALGARGITALYQHQRQAIDLVRAGQNVVVATSTASGKSLCYHVPAIQRILEARASTTARGARALYLFPTKALAQDQVRDLAAFSDAVGGLAAYTYDGDTPPATRARLRDRGDIVVTNPHMLHQGILPNHARWVDLFRELAVVVLDEVHTYRGVFGSHLANVVRRLVRLCRHHGSDPVFVATSATIANPREHVERLIERPVHLVGSDADGSPQGRRHFLLYNPPLVHDGVGLRAPAIEEVRRFAALFLRAGVQAIYFLRTRSEVEVLTKYLRDIARREAIDERRVRGYRGGYLPNERREIEAGLVSGEVLAVAATSALELGVDIGSLDAAVLVGYPGSVASLWQRAGRAGRRQGESVVVLCGRSDPLDQYLLRHPEHLFERPLEEARIDADNLVIRLAHLKCALFELPCARGERFGGDPNDPDDTEALIEHLIVDACLAVRVPARDGHPERVHWMSEAQPAQAVSLLAADADNFVIYDLDARRVFAEIDRPAALTEIFPGAIYGHQGEQYVIEELDYHNRRALARRVEVDHYTQAETDVTLAVLFEDERREWRGAAGGYRSGTGQVHVTISAAIYKKIRYYTRENVGAGEIDLPAEEMDTDAWWLVIDERLAIAAGLDEGANARALHALGRVLANLLPLYVLADRADLRVACEIKSAHFGAPVITIYEATPGGVGLARRAHGCHREVLASAVELLGACSCVGGCPSCSGAAGLESGARAGGRSPEKSVALRLAELLLATAPGGQ